MHTFVVYAPDYTHDGTLERRLLVRGQHLERIKSLKESGVITSGVLLFDPETFELPDEGQKMVGSLMIFSAETIGEVRQIIESDVYWTANVWDKDNLKIYPGK
ncbi:hypothetical protein Clacol_008803 [Clathrus columnatus]|uniref:YCII-related domain-containing protein n=1 Tax=Clathrus columnatus TaxID=1419009 RepID=A0AAV5AM25_9AGAM|nr:hypothetical protein Clacol_008803 [Clathrus columnatus]